MKKYLFGLFALVLAVGFSAYTTRTLDVEFVYEGSAVDLSEMINPENWVVSSANPTFECESGADVTCSFTADPQYAVDGKLDPLAEITLDGSEQKIQSIELDHTLITFSPTEAERP